jgi:hypothetical protein
LGELVIFGEEFLRFVDEDAALGVQRLAVRPDVRDLKGVRRSWGEKLHADGDQGRGHDGVELSRKLLLACEPEFFSRGGKLGQQRVFWGAKGETKTGEGG